MAEPLTKRRELLEQQVLPKMDEPIRYSPLLEASLKDLIQSVKSQGLEGLVAKVGIPDMSRVSARVHGRRCGSTKGKSW
jgi:ATP-dependent DNA ligase